MFFYILISKGDVVLREKTQKRKKITAVMFIIVLSLLFSGNFINYRIAGKTLLDNYREQTAQETGFFDKAKAFISSADAGVNEATLARDDFVEIYGLVQKCIHKRIMPDPMYGALYKTDDGKINFSVEKKYMDDYLGSMYDLANGLKEAGIPMLYVQFPFKLPPKNIENSLPVTANDYSNENADYFIKNLKSAKLNVYDIRSDFWNLKMNRDKMFFNTDHHWTIEAAFKATGLLERYLNKNFGFNIDEKYRDINNYNKKIYKNCFVGSMGRRVGRVYGGVDDFTLITPKFDTSFKLVENDGENSKVFRGSFEDAVLDKAYLENKDITTNRYAVYHGDNRELIFTNNKVKGGKVLIIKDSFGIPVYSFMSLGVHEVRALDLRLFNEDLLEYAKLCKPDIVIVMYNVDCFKDEMFDFKGQIK